MNTLGAVAGSGLTITLSPAQVLVCVCLLGLFVVSSAKSLLFAWHGRLFSQLARHFFLQRSRLTISSDQHGGESIFAPVVSTSYTPLLDIDYNLHKSNSTFFNDLDDSRTELMLALFKDVVKPLRPTRPATKAKMFHLGGTSCTFHKAIAPFAKYEISSRILCWDEKWIYVVSHFSKLGSNEASRFILDPHTIESVPEQAGASCQQDHIYASAITQYVFKQGRVTCTPESIMSECRLLPAQSTAKGGKGLNISNIQTQQDFSLHWSWNQVQEECHQHLEMAQNLNSLRKLQDTFIGRSGPALYTY